MLSYLSNLSKNNCHVLHRYARPNFSLQLLIIVQSLTLLLAVNNLIGAGYQPCFAKEMRIDILL